MASDHKVLFRGYLHECKDQRGSQYLFRRILCLSGKEPGKEDLDRLVGRQGIRVIRVSKEAWENDPPGLIYDVFSVPRCQETSYHKLPKEDKNSIFSGIYAEAWYEHHEESRHPELLLKINQALVDSSPLVCAVDEKGITLMDRGFFTNTKDLFDGWFDGTIETGKSFTFCFCPNGTFRQRFDPKVERRTLCFLNRQGEEVIVLHEGMDGKFHLHVRSDLLSANGQRALEVLEEALKEIDKLIDRAEDAIMSRLPEILRRMENQKLREDISLN